MPSFGHLTPMLCAAVLLYTYYRLYGDLCSLPQRGGLSSGKSEGYREGTSSDRHSEKHKSHGHKKKKSKREEKEEKKKEKKKKKGEGEDEIEKLRRERRKREDAERMRSEAVIRGLQGGGGNSLSQPEAVVEKGSGR